MVGIQSARGHIRFPHIGNNPPSFSRIQSPLLKEVAEHLISTLGYVTSFLLSLSARLYQASQELPLIISPAPTVI